MQWTEMRYIGRNFAQTQHYMHIYYVLITAVENMDQTEITVHTRTHARTHSGKNSRKYCMWQHKSILDLKIVPNA